MGFNYEPQKVATEAHHFVRFRTGQTWEKRSHLSDEAITALLLLRGLTPESDPIANQLATLEVVIEGHEAIAARLAAESEVAITEVGSVKSTAAATHLRLAAILRTQIRRTAGAPLFANPAAFGCGQGRKGFHHSAQPVRSGRQVRRR